MSPSSSAPWRQGGNRINDNQRHGSRTHEGIGYFKGLFTGIRLRNEQLVKIHAELACVCRVKGMLGIDKCANAALFSALPRSREASGSSFRRLSGP